MYVGVRVVADSAGRRVCDFRPRSHAAKDVQLQGILDHLTVLSSIAAVQRLIGHSIFNGLGRGFSNECSVGGLGAGDDMSVEFKVLRVGSGAQTDSSTHEREG